MMTGKFGKEITNIDRLNVVILVQQMMPTIASDLCPGDSYCIALFIASKQYPFLSVTRS